jgi:hypothetical protein
MPSARFRNAKPVEDLRRAIDCLPVQTRQAMLDGVLRNRRIIVGAYVDGEGGVCPMLAAHRNGGRTDFLSFAKSWDRFTRAGRRARPATRRELSILVGQLQASLSDAELVDLAGAIAEHGRLLAGRRERAHAQGVDPAADPAGEITARRLRAPAWLRRRGERVLA